MYSFAPYPCTALADWLEAEGRYGGIGFAGMSMGGINACLAACVGRRPLALTPLIAPYSAGPVFTKGIAMNHPCLKCKLTNLHDPGVISKMCDWEALTKQLPDYAEPGVTAHECTNTTIPPFHHSLIMFLFTCSYGNAPRRLNRSPQVPSPASPGARRSSACQARSLRSSRLRLA